jgi:hypothetical protein
MRYLPPVASVHRDESATLNRWAAELAGENARLEEQLREKRARTPIVMRGLALLFAGLLLASPVAMAGFLLGRLLQ